MFFILFALRITDEEALCHIYGRNPRNDKIHSEEPKKREQACVFRCALDQRANSQPQRHPKVNENSTKKMIASIGTPPAVIPVAPTNPTPFDGVNVTGQIAAATIQHLNGKGLANSPSLGT